MRVVTMVLPPGANVDLYCVGEGAVEINPPSVIFVIGHQLELVGRSRCDGS